MNVSCLLHEHKQEIFQRISDYREQTFYNFCLCVNEIINEHHPDIVAVDRLHSHKLWKERIGG